MAHQGCKFITYVIVSLFLAFVNAAYAQRNGTAETPFSILSNDTIASTQTCPAKSVNYITHTLPQQCLATGRANKNDHTGRITISSVQSSGHHESAVPKATAQASPQDGLPAASGDITISTKGISGSQSAKASVAPEVVAEASPDGLPKRGRGEETNQKVLGEPDGDSPLDNVNFLSFDDWKRQNLAKAGQSAENLAKKADSIRDDKKRVPIGIHNTFDSLGEEAEIDIDFGGFTSAGHLGEDQILHDIPHVGPQANGGADQVEGKQDDFSNVRRRSKDAGRTCKERSNYASFDCAATALKTNPECKGSTSILVENKDSYMLNICSVKNKFVIVELCDAILVDTIVLANFEFFSSQFRTFRVSVSDRYPVKLDKWMDIGTFEARNSREVQAFLVQNSLIWARYLRVEFLTHFGNEYYCPVSLLRVHGTTMMEEFNREVKESRGEDDSEIGDSDTEEESSLPGEMPEIVSAEALKSESPRNVESVQDPSTIASAIEPTMSPSALIGPEPGASTTIRKCHDLPTGSATTDLLSQDHQQGETCAPSDEPMQAKAPAEEPEAIPLVPEISPQGHANHVGKQSDEKVPVRDQAKVADPTDGVTSGVTSSVPSPSAPADQIDRNNSIETVETLKPDSTAQSKTQSASTQPAAANPTTQESFFKSVHKRLQQLEMNSTLSLQYIEDQSRILRDAFTKVEKRQLTKTSSFLDTLNTTVLTELHDFRMQYDQIWQSTVLELSSQRELTKLEVSALSTRLTFLTNEMIFQKRMAILQFALILVCLGLVLFSRYGSSATYLELPPTLQNVINKSSTSLSQYTHLETPPASPGLTSPPSQYNGFDGLNRDRDMLDESYVHDSVRSAPIAYSPPSPESQQFEDKDFLQSTDDSESVSDVSPPRGKHVRMARSSPGSPSETVSGQEELLSEPLMTPRPDARIRQEFPLTQDD